MSSTNRGAVRNASDFYATPPEAFECLVDYLPKSPQFYEPACGDGRIVNWLRNTGRRCDGNDISNGCDFLKDETRREFIITNPPFSLAFEFCQHAVKHAPDVMFLLRLNFLASQKRRAWFIEHPPKALLVLSKRPDFTGGGGDSCDYAWIYWGDNCVLRGIFHP